jgi:hypothetical protein
MVDFTKISKTRGLFRILPHVEYRYLQIEHRHHMYTYPVSTQPIEYFLLQSTGDTAPECILGDIFMEKSTAQ